MSAKVRFVVQCKKHGVESKDWDGKQVVVSAPADKKERLDGGCPYCKKEARESLEQAVA